MAGVGFFAAEFGEEGREGLVVLEVFGGDFGGHCFGGSVGWEVSGVVWLVYRRRGQRGACVFFGLVSIAMFNAVRNTVV